MTTDRARAALTATGGTLALTALGATALEPGATPPLFTAAALATLGIIGGAAPDLLRVPARAAARVLLAALVSAAVLGSGILLVAALLADRRPVTATLVAVAYLGAAVLLRAGLLDPPTARPTTAPAHRRAWSVERTPPPLTLVMPAVQTHVHYVPASVGGTYMRARGAA